MSKSENILVDYKLFDDNTIIDLAQNPRTLRPECVELLIQEIKNRKLDYELINWIQKDTKIFENREKEELINNIQSLICFKCKTQNNLNGYKFMSIISFLIFHSDEEYDLIICSSCAKKIRIRNLFLTILFGWWSIFGFIKTPFAIFNILLTIIKPLKNNYEIICTFIDINTGKLRTKNINLEKLLKEFNDENEGNEYEENE